MQEWQRWKYPQSLAAAKHARVPLVFQHHLMMTAMTASPPDLHTSTLQQFWLVTPNVLATIATVLNNVCIVNCSSFQSDVFQETTELGEGSVFTVTRESVAVRKLAGRMACLNMLPMVLLQPVRTTIANTSSFGSSSFQSCTHTPDTSHDSRYAMCR